MTESLEDRFACLHEFIPAARAALDRNVWDYIIGGSDTETTVARNRQAIDSIAFQPRVLNDVSQVDTSVSFLGKPLRIPVLLAPVGHLQRIDPGGGATVAEAATAYGVGMMKSSVAEPDIEAVAHAGGAGLKIYQLYVRGDAAWVHDCFQRAMASGYDAICVTVDTAFISRRERDITKRWSRPQSGSTFQSSVSWRDVERYRSIITVPFFLKGIATVADAMRAVALGVDGIYVSNHGGRQLDHGRGSLDVLPEIVAATGGRATIMVDGGFSRGTDIVKALALGAEVVGVGRLYLYALAVAGAPGVVRLLEILEDEIHSCLALLGICNFASLNRSYVCRAQPIGTPGVHSAFPLMTLPPERPYGWG